MTELAIKMNRCLEEADVLKWMTKGKTVPIQKDLQKGTGSNNYKLITCLLITWKTLMAQKREEIYNSLINHGLFPKKQKGYCKWTRGIEELLYVDQHILNKSKTRGKKKSIYSMDWQQKGIWYGSIKLDNKPSQNIQDIRWSHKLYQENHGNLERGIDSKRGKISWGKDPERYILGKGIITITICNNNDATQLHTLEMHRQI